MLTIIKLNGPMGEKFGRNWKLDISSPAEALSLIDANKPGLFSWIKNNLSKYDKYRIICEYHDGRKERLMKDEYIIPGKIKKISFTPITLGSGAVGRIVVGIILIIIGVFTSYAGGGVLVSIGIGLVLGGAIELLSPRPKKEKFSDRKDGDNKPSYYFNGPANTIEQGSPVQLVYGRILSGSHAISASVGVEQIL